MSQSVDKLCSQGKAVNTRPRDNDPEPDPDPPCAPPVIILAEDIDATNEQPGTGQTEAQRSEPRTSLSPSLSATDETRFARTSNTTSRQSSEQGAVSTVLSKKRAASKSPAVSRTPSPSPSPSATPPPEDKAMGSKTSKISENVNHSHGKLKLSQSRVDKAEMKEPSNYYSHRSKSIRRKAKGDGVSAEGSGGGLN